MPVSKHSRSVLRKAMAVLCAAGALFTVTSTSRAGVIIGKHATLEYQVGAADVIVRGKCEDKATTFSNKHFVTTYKITARKYLKAPGKMTLESKPSLLVSVVGGRVDRPIPLEESYPMMPVLFPGEEVVLFLRSPDNLPAFAQERYNDFLTQGLMKPSPLMNNYRLIGMNLSKLTVVKDPKTGTELVTRLNFDRYGLLPTSEVTKRYVEAYESESQTIDIQEGPRPMRLPVQIAKPMPRREMSIEQKIRQMRRFTATWEDFQSLVDELLENPEPAGVAANAGKGNASRTNRTTDSRESQ